VLYAIAEKDNPARVRVFEVYRDMGTYRSHLETAHFKATNEKMVKSSCPLDAYWLKLRVTPSTVVQAAGGDRLVDRCD
jgi:Antibiotic biosynthesis monooxygenase